MKKTFIFLLIFIVSFFVFGTFAEGVSDTNNNSVEIEDCNVDVKELLTTVENVDYYAFLNLDSAEDSLKPVILEARRMYIERVAGAIGGLAADGVYSKKLLLTELLCVLYPNFTSCFQRIGIIPVKH